MKQAFIALACAAGLCAGAEVEHATVIECRSDVRICRKDGVCQKAELGSPVFEGDTLVTGDSASVQIRFRSRTQVYGGANSRSVVTLVTAGQKALEVKWGKWNFDVKSSDAKSRFGVQTPVALAGTEGTEFSVTVDSATGETRIELLSGKLRIISLFAPQDSILMSANHYLTVRPSARLEAPVPLPPQPDTRGDAGTPEDDTRLAGEGETAPQEAEVPAFEPVRLSQTGMSVSTVEISLGVDRLYETAQNASAGFVQLDPLVPQPIEYRPPEETKTTSKVIIQIR